VKVFFVLCHQSSIIQAEIREALIAERLRDIGHDARVFRIYGGKLVKTESFHGKVPIYYFPFDKPQDDVHLLVSEPLLTFLREAKPDVILFKGIDYSLVPYVLDGLGNPKLIVGFIIGGVSVHPMLHCAKFAFIESSRQRKEITDFLSASLPCPKLAKFVDWQAVNEFWQSSKEFDIVNVGYFEPRKNLIALRPFFGKYKLAIVGHGPTLECVQAAASGFEHVHFFGKLQNRDAIRAVCRSRLMVHTSSWEGLPRVIVESLACGVPVVAFRSAIQEDFSETDGVSLIGSDDLIAAVDGLLSEPARIQELSANARQYALSAHGSQRFVDAADAIIELSRFE
jgi:glycosyltransferase involved in cell wall biosynthesis